MRGTFFIVAAILLVGPVAVCAAASAGTGEQGQAAPVSAFFQNIPDLPLMPGMAERAGEGMVFDQPQGRVVEAVSVLPRAQGEAEIRDFYGRTLPALGWTPVGGDTYMRGAETLKIEAAAQDGETWLRVVVMPR